MWDPILGALAILGMVLVLTNAPKLVDAWCDRIRYGIQNPADDLAEDVDDEPESVRPAAAAPKTATKPATTTNGAARTAP